MGPILDGPPLDLTSKPEQPRKSREEQRRELAEAERGGQSSEAVNA
jgi:hypothetical protein